MSDTSARPGSGLRRALPWITAAVLAAVCVGLVLVMLHVRRVSQHTEDVADSTKTVALSQDYQAAVQAGATEAANILTYSRKNFDADWNRALAGSTGQLHKDQESKKAQALKTITDGKIDLRGQVAQSAFETADDQGSVLVLITVNGYAVNDQGERSVQTPQRLELTMVKSGAKWLATSLTMIGIQ